METIAARWSPQSTPRMPAASDPKRIGSWSRVACIAVPLLPVNLGRVACKDERTPPRRRRRRWTRRSALHDIHSEAGEEGEDLILLSWRYGKVIQCRRGVVHERFPITLVDVHPHVGRLHVATGVVGGTAGRFSHEIHDQLTCLALIVVAGALPVVAQPRIGLQPSEQVVGRRGDRIVAPEPVIQGFCGGVLHNRLLSTGTERQPERASSAALYAAPSATFPVLAPSRLVSIPLPSRTGAFSERRVATAARTAPAAALRPGRTEFGRSHPERLIASTRRWCSWVRMSRSVGCNMAESPLCRRVLSRPEMPRRVRITLAAGAFPTCVDRPFDTTRKGHGITHGLVTLAGYTGMARRGS